jgi:gluconolactonase
MKRILSLSLILAGAAAAYGCSKQSSDPADPRPDETNTEPTAEEDAGTVPGEDGGPGADSAPAPGTPDPTGNPILLGAPRTVRTFTPPGGVPLFVDGPQWSVAKDALFVALPFATNLQGGKGILTTFKADGTNYTELRAGDKTTTGVVGNSIDKDGNLISAELKVITRTDRASGQVTVIANGYGPAPVIDPDAEAGAATPFDGPNDLVGLRDGSIFFTDPGYGIEPRPAVGHLVRISLEGVATVAASYDYNPSPNGIALSKDEKILYVGFTAPAAGTPPFIRKYTINADGSLLDMGKLVEMPVGSDPDGIAIDDDDNIYVALKTGIAVYKVSGEPYGGAGAKVPQTAINGGATSLTFGGADRKSLFVTTTGKVLELKTSVAGLLQ